MTDTVVQKDPLPEEAKIIHKAEPLEGFEAIAGMVIVAAIIVLYFGILYALALKWDRERRQLELEEMELQLTMREKPAEIKPKKTIRKNAGIKRTTTADEQKLDNIDDSVIKNGQVKSPRDDADSMQNYAEKLRQEAD